MGFDRWLAANHSDLVAAANDEDLDATDRILDMQRAWEAGRAATIAELRRLAEEVEAPETPDYVALLTAWAALRWAADRLAEEQGK